MREQILTFLEKNSRIDPKELAILLGSDEVTIMNEIAKMEEEKVDRKSTRLNSSHMSESRMPSSA